MEMAEAGAETALRIRLRGAVDAARYSARQYTGKPGSEHIVRGTAGAFESRLLHLLEEDPRIRSAFDTVSIAAAELERRIRREESDPEAARARLLKVIEKLEQTILEHGRANGTAEALGYLSAGAPLRDGLPDA